MQYTIDQVAAPRTWTDQHGMKVDYWLNLREFPQDRVVLTQKPETPAPTAGQMIAGDITQKPNGMFKITKDYGGTAQAVLEQKAEVMTERHQGPNELDLRITRQHSQEMAIRFLALVADDGGDRPGLEEVLRMTDWFQHDVYKDRRPDTAVRQQQAATSAPAATNGGEPRLASPAQIEKFLKPRMANVDATSLHHLFVRFGITRIEELPMGKVDEFAQAMTQPVATGEADMPSPEPVPVRQVETESTFPF